MKGYLTTQQVANMHGVSRSRVVQWIRDGELQAEKVNQIWLVKAEVAKAHKRRPITGRPKKKGKA